MKTTSKEYAGIEAAYNYLNKSLFDGELPACLIVLQRKARAMGTHCANRFVARVEASEGERISEISLNPDFFEGHSDTEILSTMAHEMAHLWQHTCGKPGRGGWHNRQWAERMESIGLMPSNTGKPEGKKTGQKMSDYIIPGGQFHRRADDLLSQGFSFNWESHGAPKKPAANKNKIKYSCPECGVNAWGKPELNMICGECNEGFVGE